MSYDNDKKAFDRTAKRIMDSARQSGKNMSFKEAQDNLRGHLDKSRHKK
tara:strand:- start:2730 stop:2876 length:147 start_codon:yes stop_codon:yes gene_type:complete